MARKKRSYRSLRGTPEQHSAQLTRLANETRKKLDDAMFYMESPKNCPKAFWAVTSAESSLSRWSTHATGANAKKDTFYSFADEFDGVSTDFLKKCVIKPKK